MPPLHSIFPSSSSSSLLSSSSVSPSLSLRLPSKPTSKLKPIIIITSCTQQPKPASTSTSTSTSNSNANYLIKAPTPPWMTSPLLLPPHHLVNLSHPKPNTKPKTKTLQQSLTQSIRGGRNRQAMKKIVQSISQLQQTETQENQEVVVGFSGNVPWVRAEEKRVVFRREKKERVVTEAERVLDEGELGRLRAVARGMRRWVKAKKAGVTGEVVDEILRRWREEEEELVMVRFVDPLSRNLDRAREILEIKTGGLVVWSKKDTLVIYRENNRSNKRPKNIEENSQTMDMDYGLHTRVGSISESLYEKEANRLLDGLGPRFIDWWWKRPLPVDADLLPEVVPDFRPPFRLCLPGEKPKLKNSELTYLRKLARPLPTHFALGKNKKLQGLASAIIKLWEKSPIAKIAVKVGIQNTDDEQMAEQLKCLTGGVLILRNKYFIILYRGKDFVPDKVATTIHERENELHVQQLMEEEARAKAIESFDHLNESGHSTSNTGSISEFKDIEASYRPLNDGASENKIKIEAEKEKVVKQLKDEEHKLSILKLKIERSEKELGRLNSSWSSSEQSGDQELLTEEERRSFRRIGLKMDEFLLLGRRGVYNGTIESINQHWKHREVVKVITMQKAFHQINYTAKLLEIESGGVLVAVEKLKSGHAIIIYRGKNYNRMLKPSTDNLLTKKEALQKSIEIQRRGSMKYFAWQKQRTLSELRQKLRDLERRSRELDTMGGRDRRIQSLMEYRKGAEGKLLER